MTKATTACYDGAVSEGIYRMRPMGGSFLLVPAVVPTRASVKGLLNAARRQARAVGLKRAEVMRAIELVRNRPTR